MALAVEISNLCKRFGKFQALDDISLSVPEGEIYGLLGPNGAGKTTTIKAMVGALTPTSGTVRILGMDPLKNKKKVRRKIGYMPQYPALYEDLSARDNILFFGRLHDVPNLKKEVEEILEFTELQDRASDPVYTFSGGMKKRVSLACALIHKPKILFLDEPTAAVDPHLKMRSWELFKKLAKEGVTIFVSTHLMDEALLCDKLAIMRKGQLLAVSTPKKLMEQGSIQWNIRKDNSTLKRTSSGNPQKVAEMLQEFGLKKDVTSVSFMQETLEEIVLDMIQRSHHE